MDTKLVGLVSDCMKELFDQDDGKPNGQLNADTPLFGKDGTLDSVDLVNLIVAVEEAIEARYGIAVTLADERAVSRKHSPFLTIGSLAQYSADRIAEHG